MPLSISTNNTTSSRYALNSPRTPPGGHQTFTFNDTPVMVKSLTSRGLHNDHRSSKKMTIPANQSSMKNLLQMASEEPATPRKKSVRVAPGGNTTIQECFATSV